MTASKQKKRGRAALILLLCLLVLCLAAGGTAYALLRQKVRAIQAGAEFDFSYTVTSSAAETPALYGVLQQAGAAQGTVSGQYAPGKFQFTLTSGKTGNAFTRVYIDAKETLYDAGQLYTYLRNEVVSAAPLAGLVLPGWSMGSYISQTQLASLLGVDDTATSLQSMSDFQLDLKKIKKVQPENAKEGYLYFRLETDDTAADSPVLTLGVEKSGLLRAASPAVHILLDIPAHGIHTELTGTVTPAAPTLTAPTSRMQDSDIASLVQLRQTVESVVQFVQGAASGTQSAS